MGFSIADNLVIGVGSSALFELAGSLGVCEAQGVEPPARDIPMVYVPCGIANMQQRR